jgi:hypothetical protein
MRGSTTPVVVDFDKFDKYHDFTFVLLAKKLLYIIIYYELIRWYLHVTSSHNLTAYELIWFLISLVF